MTLSKVIKIIKLYYAIILGRLEIFNKLLSVNRWIFFWLILSAGISILSIVTNNLDYLIEAYVFLLVGSFVAFKKYPGFSLFIISIIIFLGTITSAIIFQKIEILNAGITLILVIITGWYAHLMNQQLDVTQRTKKGKFIAEISRSIFTPIH